MKPLLYIALILPTFIFANNEVEEYKKNALGNLGSFLQKSTEEQKVYITKNNEESFNNGKKAYNEMGCGGCHPKGDTIGTKVDVKIAQVPIPSLKGVADRFPQFKPANDKVINLEQMNNNCIVLFTSKPPLDVSTQEAIDLANYVSKF